MKKSIFALTFGFILLSVGQTPVEAADAVAGRIAFETCRGCHSVPGYSNAYPTYYVPKVAGQRAEYLVSALKAYKEKSRPHGTMKANSSNLSDKTIENIAAFLESEKRPQTASPAKGDAEAGQKLAESCVSCHSEKPDVAGNIPRLAGQYGNYLVRAMKDYQSGKRKNAIMQSMVQGLSNDDLENISAYFASQKGLMNVR